MNKKEKSRKQTERACNDLSNDSRSSGIFFSFRLFYVFLRGRSSTSYFCRNLKIFVYDFRNFCVRERNESV